MKSKNKQATRMAICYDFDGTLSPDYMQNVEFLKRLGYTNSGDFWDEVKDIAKEKDMDETLTYMNLMIDKAKEKSIPLTESFLMECGRNIKFFDGVETWFERINAYAKAKKINIEHYIITSGNEEILKGTSISKHFKYIFGCRFAYTESSGNKIAEKPAASVNYTNKTQHLFRINKGIFNYWQNEEVNRYMPKEKKYIDFSNMVYIGDGETDVPCMKMVMYQGGKALAVFNQNSRAVREEKNEKGEIIQKAKRSSEEIAKELHQHGRVNFIAPADYSENSKIERILKNIIDEIDLKRC